MSCKSYSLDFKLKVIEEAENGKIPKKDLCAKFNIAPSTLSTFLKNREKIGQSRKRIVFRKAGKNALITNYRSDY